MSRAVLSKRRRHELSWLLIFLMAAILLLVDLGGKSLWVDELFTAQVSGQQHLGELLRQLANVERRPPLFFFLMHYWMPVVGNSEWALRLPAALFGLLSLPLLASLARRLGLGERHLIAVAVLGAMPTFVLYARMARAYSMAMAVGLLSVIAFVALLQHPTRRRWLAYLIASTVLLYTDYALMAILVAQNVFVAYLWLRKPRAALTPGGFTPPRLAAWCAGQATLLLAFTPWLAVLVAQSRQVTQAADFAHGLSGYLIKLIYPILSLSTGETIFPWNPAAIGAMIGVACLFVAGIATIGRKNRDVLVFTLTFLIIPFLFTAFLLSSVAPDITFINMVSRTLFVLPFFALVLAAGLHSFPATAWKALTIGLLALGWGTGLFNYYTGRDFHNPIYVTPMREMAQAVAARALPGDVIVSDLDSGFGYYYGRTNAITPLFSSLKERDAARQAITAQRSPRVWLVALGRDRTRIDAPAEQFASWLSDGYRLAETTGYAPEDARYRQLKETLLKRVDYQYKASVRLYVAR